MVLKQLVRKIAGKIAGVNKVQEQVDTVFYFLNHYFDITKAPKATGALRDVQLGDSLLLQVFDKVCRKQNLTYWLDGGTLLGAVRHGGFIPWDDDVDVCMPRNDYNRAKILLCDELQKYGIDVAESIRNPMGCLGIGYRHKQTGLWIDVFPVDYCSMDMDDCADRNILNKQIKKYRKYYWKKKNYKSQEVLLEKKSRIFSGLSSAEAASSLFFTPEFVVRLIGWNMDTVYPLQKISFENYEYCAPADINRHLRELYGESYMQFPRTGVMHHGDERGGLASWAEHSGTDMTEIRKELEVILTQLES